jgi:predicted dehydrogenase
MKVLIIGLGSIAKKHVTALRKIEPEAEVFALRSGISNNEEPGVTNISELSECADPDFIMVCNPTAGHAAAIRSVAPLNKPLFIEKPPFHNLQDASEIVSLISKHTTYTAFNLRFLDCLSFLKKNISIDKVQEVNIYCGSYLPSWRTSDFRSSYSAEHTLGGGVHLDLIHEIDYALWLFGKPDVVRCTLRSQSALNINSTDFANYALLYKNFTINIVLNYYRRDAKRSCEILFTDTTWYADLLNNSVTDVLSGKTIQSSAATVLDTYEMQLRYFIGCLRKNEKPFNSIEESTGTLKIALP